MAAPSQPVKAFYLGGREEKIALECFPSECPLCHHKQIPKYIYTVIGIKTELAHSVFQCTNTDCLELFIGSYSKTTTGSYRLDSTAPNMPVKKEFNKVIKELSPLFIEIYHQAIFAEAMQLNQIAGVGLRKAFEFLIKDYCNHLKPDDEEKIKKMNLGNVIQTYIDNESLKNCAKRASWLGNDETHYFRKWENNDIKDLKNLIEISVSGIENSLLAAKYLEEMPDPSTS